MRPPFGLAASRERCLPRVPLVPLVAVLSSACGGPAGGAAPTLVTSVVITAASVPASGRVGTAYLVTVTAAASNADGTVPVDSIVVTDADERKVALAGTFSQSLTLGLAAGTEVVQVVAYSHDLEAGPIRTAYSSRNITRTPAPAPPTASQVSIAFPEADSSSADLAFATSGKSNRAYALLDVPPQLLPTLTGTILSVRGVNGDVNGNLGFKYVVSDSVGADTADVVVTISPMVDFSFSLREARTDSVITSPAQLIVEGHVFDAVNGVFAGQVPPGVRSIGLVANASTFQSDRVLGPDGTLLGVNWPGNDTLRRALSSDFASSGRIVRLAKEGSPYGPLGEFMRLYNLVWTWFGTEQRVPAQDSVTIAIYAGPADTLWGYTRMLSPAELNVVTLGALDAVSQFSYTDYVIRIDTVYTLPQWIADLQVGVQVVGGGPANDNVTLRGSRSEWMASAARLAPGFGRETVRDELYSFHAGQQNEDVDNLAASFFCSNRCGYADLSPGDSDFIQFVNRLFVRDAELKRLANGRAGFRLVE